MSNTDIAALEAYSGHTRDVILMVREGADEMANHELTHLEMRRQLSGDEYVTVIMKR